jgi:hypothetical protein
VLTSVDKREAKKEKNKTSTLELMIFSVFAKCPKMLKVGDLNQNPTQKWV